MENGKKVKKISPQSLQAVFILSAVLIAFTFTGSGSLKRTNDLVLEIDQDLYQNHHFPSENEIQPEPLITDLEGDGKNELLISRLIVPDRTELQLFNIEKKASKAPLPTMTYPFPEGYQPIAMRTGYIEPYVTNSTISRSQVIVVVSKEWKVSCFDKDLHLLWEAAPRVDLTPEVMKAYITSEIDVLIVPKNLHSHDRGMVVVGGRLKESHDIGAHHAGEADTDLAHQLTHFSYFALDGKTGERRWVHRAESGPAADGGWRDSLRDMRHPDYNDKHRGERVWTEYSRDMLQQLPHRWEGVRDTKLTVAHFSRDHIGDSRRDNEFSTNKVPSAPKHIQGVAASLFKLGAHNEMDHVVDPNVIVAHNSMGIEVIHIVSGDPVTHMVLSASRGTFGDLNGDHVIEHVTAIPEEEDTVIGRHGVSHRSRDITGHQGCQGVSSDESELRRGSVNFKVDICARSSVVYSERDDSIEVVQPLIMRDPLSRRQHAVFYVSSGLVTMLGPRGDIIWQRKTSSGWGRPSHWEDEAVLPSITAFEDAHDEELILVAGDEKISIIGADDGIVQLSSMLDGVPIAAPVIGDVDNDGHNDVIVHTIHGYELITLYRKRGSMALTTFAAVLTIGVGVVLLYLTSLQQKERKKQGHAARYVAA
eukprot:TRINITY_DN1691_c0_g1_i1.p1 TRINITY_DN1691_c0_g1~~TRINITY_DN1691_c0_g1_i1.p1  ORF type:complete len:647 (-),score=191.76 TRINITY_DN1691_c0_g1_i1:153-2093(-)